MTQFPDDPPPNQPPYGSAPPPAPGYGQDAGAGTPPPNYLVWAILSTVLCCLPLGVVSIVFAAQVNGKYAVGDYAGAQDSSDKARKFAIWSAVAGLVVGAVWVILLVVGVFSLSSSSSTVG